MATSNIGAAHRKFKQRVPSVSQLNDGRFSAPAEQRTAESDGALRNDRIAAAPYHSALGFGGLLEHPTASAITCVYITVALAVCLFYNVNFVYVFLVITNLVLAFVRFLTMWQMPRNPWMGWFIATNLAKSLAFFLAFMVVFRPDVADDLRLWLRYTWMVVFVLITVGASDKATEVAHYLRAKREIYESQYRQVFNGDECAMTKTVITWLSDVYTRYGWLATLVCLVVIVALIVGVCWLFGISPAAMAAWLGMG